MLPDIPADASRRTAGFILALAIELLIVLLLLTLGLGRSDPRPEVVTVSSFDVSDQPEQDTPEQEEPESEPPSADAQQAPEPQPVQPEPVAPALVLPPSALPIPTMRPTPTPVPSPAPTPSATSSIGAVVRPDSNYGPANSGSSRGPDSQRVGTAPDGSPLYAARWYREPTDADLAGYLSTANSAGWGLIACKTAPNWRVEECVELDEYPNGSGIARATRAAAWQFLVRPPRLGGEYQIGSWVRIRIDYTRSRRQPAY